MKKERIAYVVQRYGLEVNGGSEYACRELAEHLRKEYDVEVLTTCARNAMPWDNYYDEGTSIINGVLVRRFQVEKVKDEDALNRAAQKLYSGIFEDEIRWIEEKGPYCPQLISYVKHNADQYKVVMFETYDFYPTVMGLLSGIKNSIIVPTAHDEPNIYKNIYRKAISMASGILYNSIEERELLIQHFHTGNKPGRTTCVGIKELPSEEFTMPDPLKKYENYVIYVGRVAHGKNFMQLNRYFIEYKKRNPGDLKLLVLGRINNYMKLQYYEDIIYLDFVSEEEKRALMHDARCLIMPSLYESLSLVILESMQVGTPVLVNGGCAVLKGQCIRSNAGLYYTSYGEFEKELNLLLEDDKLYQTMSENGKCFVRDNYQWDTAVENVKELIEIIAGRAM